MRSLVLTLMMSFLSHSAFGAATNKGNKTTSQRTPQEKNFRKESEQAEKWLWSFVEKHGTPGGKREFKSEMIYHVLDDKRKKTVSPSSIASTEVFESQFGKTKVDKLRQEAKHHQQEAKYDKQEHDKACEFYSSLTGFKGFKKLNIIDPRTRPQLPALSSFIKGTDTLNQADCLIVLREFLKNLSFFEERSLPCPKVFNPDFIYLDLDNIKLELSLDGVDQDKLFCDQNSSTYCVLKGIAHLIIECFLTRSANEDELKEFSCLESAFFEAAARKNKSYDGYICLLSLVSKILDDQYSSIEELYKYLSEIVCDEDKEPAEQRISIYKLIDREEAEFEALTHNKT